MSSTVELVRRSLSKPDHDSADNTQDKERKAKPPPATSPPGSKHRLRNAVCAVAVVLLVVSCVGVWFLNHCGLLFDSVIKNYTNGLQDLRALFKNQTDRFWRILERRGLAHFKEKTPSRPLVILFVASPSAHNVVGCFSKKLAAKLDPKHAKELLTIDGKNFSMSHGDETKETLDKMLSDKIRSGHQLALVHNLDLLPHPSPLLFYSYCDNDNAPYKHASFLFTVHLPREPDPSLSPVETEGLVRNYLLKEVWITDGYNQDAMKALLGRIIGTVVVVNGEYEATLKSVCNEYPL